MTEAQQRLLFLVKGNADAFALVELIRNVANVWDNLVDRDVPVSDAAINKAFFDALVGIPCNPFYQQCATYLQPIMQTGIFNWMAANRLEHSGQHGREIAHVLRYAISDVVVAIVYLVGGYEWAAEHTAEVKLLTQQDSLGNYLTELEGKYGLP